MILDFLAQNTQSSNFHLVKLISQSKTKNLHFPTLLKMKYFKTLFMATNCIYLQSSNLVVTFTSLASDSYILKLIFQQLAIIHKEHYAQAFGCFLKGYQQIYYVYCYSIIQQVAEENLWNLKIKSVVLGELLGFKPKLSSLLKVVYWRSLKNLSIFCLSF